MHVDIRPTVLHVICLSAVRMRASDRKRTRHTCSIYNCTHYRENGTETATIIDLARECSLCMHANRMGAWSNVAFFNCPTAKVACLRKRLRANGASI